MSIGYKCAKPVHILSESIVAKIHEGTLDILKEYGVKFDDPEALQILDQAGCRVDKRKSIVKFPPQLIEEALKTKPDVFYLKGRNPKYDLKFSGSEVYFTNHGAPQIIDFDSGRPKVASLDDVRMIVTIIDALEDYHACFTTAMNLSDKPVGMLREWIAAQAYRYTEKSTIGTSLKGCPKWMIRMADSWCHLDGCHLHILSAGVRRGCAGPSSNIQGQVIRSLFRAAALLALQPLPLSPAHWLSKMLKSWQE